MLINYFKKGITLTLVWALAVQPVFATNFNIVANNVGDLDGLDVVPRYSSIKLPIQPLLVFSLLGIVVISSSVHT